MKEKLNLLRFIGIIWVIFGLFNPCFSITRSQVVQNALDWEYTDNWTPQTDTATFGTYTFQSHFRTAASGGNPPYNREAYVYGGIDNEGTFINRINNGVCPGGRNFLNATHSTGYLYERGYNVANRLAGIDCSAFASACLEIPRRGTVELADRSLRVSNNNLKPGDLLIIPNVHVKVVTNLNPLTIAEAAGGRAGYVRVIATLIENYTRYSPFPQFTNWSPSEGPATNTDTPTIRVTIRSGTNILAGSIIMRIDGTTVTPTLSPSSNARTINVSYTPTNPLSDGTHTVYIYAQNVLDLEDVATHTFTIDTLPPKVAYLKIIIGTKTTENKITLY